MKRALLILILAILPLCGCSVLTVVPQPTGTANLAPGGKMLMENRNDVAVSVGYQDTSLVSQSPVDNLIAFVVTIENNSNQEVSIPLASMILIDASGHQYRPETANKVVDMVKQKSPYLVPYPYVGYYYEQDNARAGSINAMTSSVPYYAENQPQDIFTQALPDEAVIPGAKITGLVYFVADLSTTSSLDFRIYPAGAAMTGTPLYSFAFSIEKQ